MTQLYRLLTGDDTSAFCHKVTKALQEGWVLHGGPSYAFDEANGVMRCAQAVVKDSDAAYDPNRSLSEQ